MKCRDIDGDDRSLRGNLKLAVDRGCHAGLTKGY